jgi:hypothetical protein
MKTLAFKLVSKKDGKLFSYCSDAAFRKSSEYKLGEITKPRDGYGPLACFSSIEGALNFFRRDFGKVSVEECPWEIYGLFLCEIEIATETDLWSESLLTYRTQFFSIKEVPGAITVWSVKLLAEIPYQKHFEILEANFEG